MGLGGGYVAALTRSLLKLSLVQAEHADSVILGRCVAWSCPLKRVQRVLEGLVLTGEQRGALGRFC